MNKIMFVKYAGLAINLNLVASIAVDDEKKAIIFYASPIKNVSKKRPIINIWGFDTKKECEKALSFIEKISRTVELDFELDVETSI